MLPKNRLTLVLLLFQAETLRADDEFHYFSNPEVDYWHEEVPLPAGHAATAQAPTPAKAGSFSWKKYLNPQNDEFFKEGDYTPPAPFMEIARNPTDGNIANWFQYLETKNEITRRLQAKLVEYAAKRGQPLVTETAPVQVSTPPVTLVTDAKRFRLRLYFDSKCPHCHHMLGTVSELSRLGYWVELKQIDSDVSARAAIPFPVTAATPSELKQYQIQGVPLLLVGDLKRHTFFKIQGYQTAEAVLQTLRSEPNPGAHL